MTLREATADDWPEVVNLFLSTPLEAGTAFVLDRRPDFGALPALRGRFRTFLVRQEGRLAGTVTALWHDGRDGVRTITVGEVIDFRVAPWARRGRAAFLLLRAAYHAFVTEKADWVVCLIGNENRTALPCVAQRAGLPLLAPLQEYASIHFVAWRVPRVFASRSVNVREAVAADAAVIREACDQLTAQERFAPLESMVWPDPSGRHHAWIAFRPDGTTAGVLVVWDSRPVRQIRVVRYAASDGPLRAITRVAALMGLAVPLPDAGGVLGLWASRCVAVRHGGAETLRALLGAALTAAVGAGQSVVQLNLAKDDPLLQRLPPYPRSTFTSTLYGAPLGGDNVAAEAQTGRFHVDIARV